MRSAGASPRQCGARQRVSALRLVPSRQLRASRARSVVGHPAQARVWHATCENEGDLNNNLRESPMKKRSLIRPRHLAALSLALPARCARAHRAAAPEPDWIRSPATSASPPTTSSAARIRSQHQTGSSRPSRAASTIGHAGLLHRQLELQRQLAATATASRWTSTAATRARSARTSATTSASCSYNYPGSKRQAPSSSIRPSIYVALTSARPDPEVLAHGLERLLRLRRRLEARLGTSKGRNTGYLNLTYANEIVPKLTLKATSATPTCSATSDNARATSSYVDYNVGADATTSAGRPDLTGSVQGANELDLRRRRDVGDRRRDLIAQQGRASS